MAREEVWTGEVKGVAGNGRAGAVTERRERRWGGWVSLGAGGK